MSTSLNAKPVRLLMHDMAKSFGLKPGDVFARPQAVQWFKQHYPNVKEGTVLAHLIRLSTNVPTRPQYSPKQDGSDDLLFKVDASHFRLYAPGKDPTPVAPAAALPQSDDTGDMEDPGEPIVGSSEFAYEHDLRDSSPATFTWCTLDSSCMRRTASAASSSRWAAGSLTSLQSMTVGTTWSSS